MRCTHRRTLLVALVGALVLLGGCASKKTMPDPAKATGIELLVLHTNDTHAHIAGIDKYGNACFDDTASHGGMARVAAAIKTAKEKQDNVIALDAGDQFQGTLFFMASKWPMLAAINQYVPYDAMTFGNHEFDMKCSQCAQFSKKVPFPIVAANLAPQKDCAMLGAKYQPYIIKEVRGQKVGIIGLANDEPTKVALACPNTAFVKAEVALRKSVQELQAQGVVHIIALTHLGLSADRALACTVDGVDIIVGGHSHSYLGEGSEEGAYPIVEHSPNGKTVLVVSAKHATEYLGELTVGFDTAGNVVNWHGAARALLPTDPRTPAVSQLVKKYERPLAKYRNHTVGSVDIPQEITDGMSACRKGECLTGMVLTDAMLEYARPYGASVALLNGGGVRAALPKGRVSRGNLLEVQPFNNLFVVRELTGEQILAALEHGVASDAAERPALLQVAGLRYSLDMQKPAGSRVKHVELVDAQGASSPLSMQKLYRAVLLEYLARGGDGYTMFKNTKVVPSSEEVDAVVLERYLKKHKPLTTITTNRIMFAK